MTTYASPSALKWILLIVNSCCFIIGLGTTIYGIIQLIGVRGPHEFREPPPPPSPPPTEVVILDPSENVSMSTTTKATSDPGNLNYREYQDRFPSVGSGTTIFLVGLLTLSLATIGSTGANMESPRVLFTYAYLAIISCFTKFLFLYATLQMHQSNPEYDFLSLRPVLGFILTALIELILGMCSCSLAKTLKRGDAAIPKLRRYSSLLKKRIVTAVAASEERETPQQ